MVSNSVCLLSLFVDVSGVSSKIKFHTLTRVKVESDS